MEQRRTGEKPLSAIQQVRTLVRKSVLMTCPGGVNARRLRSVGRSRQLDLFRGTLAPFFRASERPMAIACFRLFTLPPLPPFPDRKVPFFFLCIALFTDLPAARPYLAIASS